MKFTEDLAQHTRQLRDLEALQQMLDEFIVDDNGELILTTGDSAIHIHPDNGITLVHNRQRISLEQIAKMYLLYQYLLESLELPPPIKDQLIQ